MLDQPEDLLSELKGRVQLNYIQPIEFDSSDTLYCPACKKMRRMHITLVTKYSQLPQHILRFNYECRKFDEEYSMPAKRGWFARIFGKKVQPAAPPTLNTEEPPSLFTYSCLQCNMRFAALLYLANNCPALIVLPNSVGDLATPNTPGDVAYYANEGHKAACVNAVAASVAMFRAALDQLLKEQGYTGTLKQNINQLETAVKAGTGPAWTKQVNVDLLDVLKELGDSSMHAADYSKKAAYDRLLAARSQLALTVILNAVYERAQADANLLTYLKTVINSL